MRGGAFVSQRRREAFTVLELLIVLAVLAVLGNVVYRVFQGTDRAARNQTERSLLVSQAQVIREALSSALRANALAVVAQPKEASWRPHRCAFPIALMGEEGGVGLCVIEGLTSPGAAETSGTSRIALTRTAANGETVSAQSWGQDGGEASCELSLQYATTLNGVRPKWVDGLEPGKGPPRLVKARLWLRSRRDADVSLTFEAIFDL